MQVHDVCPHLSRGSTLVSCPRMHMLSDLPGVIQRMEVDACELTPSVAGSLLKKRSNAPNLRLLLTIGEMLTEPVINEFGGDSAQPSLLWGMYGPTEATIHWYVYAKIPRCASAPELTSTSSVLSSRHSLGRPRRET